MKNLTVLLVLILLMISNICIAQQGNNRKSTATANEVVLLSNDSKLELSHTQVIPIKDTKTGRNYELYLKLPENYSEDSVQKYPVIYYTDAMWHVEILSSSTEFMLEDVILVGISWQIDINEDLKKEAGDHVSRYRDYSISKSNNTEYQTKYQFGQASTHLDFIRNDVIRYIDNNYRTDTDSRTYFGYSLSGEFGAYILLTKPETFDNYIIGSPSIKNEVPLLSELNTAFGSFESTDRNSSLNANVFIAHGSLEKEAAEPIDSLIDILNRRRDDGLSLQKKVIEGDHSSAFPMTAVRSIAWLSKALDHKSSSKSDISFFNFPQLNRAYIKSTPEDKKDGLIVNELGANGENKDMIVQFAKEMAEGKLGRFDSFLIGHKGKLVFESYYSRGRINLPHPQASATKTYTALLLGRAIQLGYLTMDDLDKPLISFFKGLDQSKFVKGIEKVTLHQALTSRTGIRLSEEEREVIKENPGLIKGQSQVQFLLEHSAPITEEAQVFKYGDGVELIMQVIESVVPGSAKDFIKNELLGKVGITNYNWKTAPSGLPESGWRSSLTSRDMAKLGSLILNKGKWNNEQLIPEAYIAKASHRHHYTDEDVEGGKDVSNQGYGYFMWNADLKHGNKSYYAFSAQGGYGQFIIFIQELDLMVVFTATDNDTNYLQLTAERILPAFIQ